MREEWLRHGCRFGGRQPCAVILQLRRITRMCMRYLVICVVLSVQLGLNYCNNFNNVVIFVTAVVTGCLPCFGLSLDCGQMIPDSGRLGFAPDRPDLLSGFVLSILYLLCKLHEI